MFALKNELQYLNALQAMEECKSDRSDSALAMDFSGGSKPFWSSPSLRDLLSELIFSEPKQIVFKSSSGINLKYRKEATATNNFRKIYKTNINLWRVELERYNIFHSSDGRVMWESSSEKFPTIDEIEQFYKDPEEGSDLFLGSPNIDSYKLNEKFLQILNCRSNPFRFDFRVGKIVSEKECVLRGHVKHGLIEVGQWAYVLINSKIKNVKIIDASNVGIRIKKIFGGLFPEILVEHEIGREFESGILMDEDALSEAPKWIDFSNKQKLALKSINHRNEEIKKLKKELRSNLNLLLDKGSPRLFEELVSDLFVQMGGICSLTPPSRDGGKDIIVELDGKKYFVECKLFSKENKVGRPLIQKLAGVVATEKAIGIFVTTSNYTEGAKAYAKKANIDLWDFDKLSKIVAEHLPNKKTRYLFTESCLECGGLAEFDLLGAGTISYCPSGHQVSKTIFPDHCGYEST